MKWDFSIRQRAEDRIQDDQQWAAHQRLLKRARAQAEGASQAVSAGRQPFPQVRWADRLWKKLAGIAGISLLLIAVFVGNAGAATCAAVVRCLQ